MPAHMVLPVATLRPRPSRVGQPRTGRRSVDRRGLESRSNPAAHVPDWLGRYGMMAWYAIGIIIVASLVVFATTRIQFVFAAIFIALVFTSVLNPLVDLLQRALPRGLAIVLALLGSFAFFGGLLYYVVYSVVGQWETLADEFYNGITDILDFLENGPLPWHITQAELSDWIDQSVQQITDYVQSNAGDLAGRVLTNAGNIVLAFTIFALSLFLTIFFLLSGRRMWLWFLNELPGRNRHTVHRTANAAWYTFSGYARGTMIVASADALLAFILLTAVAVPLAAPLSVLVFIGAFIPLIGAPLAMVIAAVVALASGGFVKALIVTLGIALIGQIEGHVLEPLVMGKQVSLHPVVVALGVTAGTFLGGLFGAIIAIPILAVAWAVFTALRRPDPPLAELP